MAIRFSVLPAMAATHSTATRTWSLAAMCLAAAALVVMNAQGSTADADVAALKGLGYDLVKGADYLPGPDKLLTVAVCTSCILL